MITIKEYTFDMPLDHSDIYAWRGAMGAHALRAYQNKKMSAEFASYFTNHDIITGELIERYAHIQYRSENGKAVIWATQEGILAMDSLICHRTLAHFEINGHENIHLQLIHTSEKSYPIATVSDTEYEYRITHFIPFNEDKYQAYQEANTYLDKVALIQQVLLNEIVLWAYFTNVPNMKEQKIKVDITDILHQSIMPIKTKTKAGKPLVLGLHSFHLRFRTNLFLPHTISLGRHKAYGYGVVTIK